MQRWDKALLAACDRYPNMRIYDWASDVKDNWFIDDGIHFTTPATAAAQQLIADALLDAFPAGGEVDNPDNADCLIGSDGARPPRRRPRRRDSDSSTTSG